MNSKEHHPSRYCGLASLAALLALTSPAAPSAPAEAFDPKPATGDLSLPMPGGGSMAFRPISIGEGSSPYAVREFRMGDRQSGAYQEYPTAVVVGGSFRSGDDWVFYFGKYEVSEAQYKAVMGDAAGAGGAHPVTGVSWFDAMEFVNRYNQWLFQNAASKLPRNGDRVGYLRLPTEIEWEFVARGGSAVSEDDFDLQHPYKDEIRLHEWYSGPESSHNEKQPIGLLKPNPLGIHDLLGNVSEMTSSPYMVEYYQGRVGGFVYRGGDFFTPKEKLRSSQRGEASYYGRGDQPKPSTIPTLGLRLVLSAPLHVGGAGRGEMQEAWEDYRETRIVPTLPTPGITVKHDLTTDLVKGMQDQLGELRKAMRSGGTITPQMISRIGLFETSLGDVESMVNSSEKRFAEAGVKDVVRSGYTVAREMRKIEIGERMLKFISDPAKRAAAVKAHEDRKKNLEDSWAQYRDGLQQIGGLNPGYVETAFGDYLKRAERLGLEQQPKTIAIIKKHLARYRDTQRITFADYADDFSAAFE